MFAEKARGWKKFLLTASLLESADICIAEKAANPKKKLYIDFFIIMLVLLIFNMNNY